MSQVTNMAINAKTAPNKNGGPGRKCFNYDYMIKIIIS